MLGSTFERVGEAVYGKGDSDSVVAPRHKFKRIYHPRTPEKGDKDGKGVGVVWEYPAGLNRGFVWGGLEREEKKEVYKPMGVGKGWQSWAEKVRLFEPQPVSVAKFARSKMSIVVGVDDDDEQEERGSDGESDESWDTASSEWESDGPFHWSLVDMEGVKCGI